MLFVLLPLIAGYDWSFTNIDCIELIHLSGFLLFVNQDPFSIFDTHLLSGKDFCDPYGYTALTIFFAIVHVHNSTLLIS